MTRTGLWICDISRIRNNFPQFFLDRNGAVTIPHFEAKPFFLQALLNTRQSFSGGLAEVTPEDPALAEVVISSHAASVLAGGVRLRDAIRLGHARARSADVLRRADGLLATPSFLSYDGF